MRTLSALSDAVYGIPGRRGVPGIANLPLSSLEVLQRVHNGLDTLVTEDVLGPGWWRKGGLEVPLGGEPEPTAPHDPHRSVEILAALKSASLSPREREILAAKAHQHAGQSEADLARMLDMAYSTFRGTLRNARQKISKLL